MHDLNAIRAFDALCTHKSLTAAAAALNQPKSTVSRRLSQLEEDIGQALVARNGNRLVITHAGEVFATYSRQFLALAAQSQEALDHLNNEVEGEMTIIAPPSLMQGWFGEVLDQFLQLHPHIKIRLLSQPISGQHGMPDLILSIGENREPCAFKQSQLQPFEERGYNNCWRKSLLGSIHYAAYVSPDYLEMESSRDTLVHPYNLRSHPVLSTPWTNQSLNAPQQLVFTHPDLGRYVLSDINCRLQSDCLFLHIDAIVKGKGVGLLPTWVATSFMKKHPHQIVPCLGKWQCESLPINYHVPSGRLPLRLTALLTLMQERLPDEWR